MMMIMLAGFVDSLTTPIKSWLDTFLLVNQLNTIYDDHRHMMVIKEVGVDTHRVECIVCLSEVTVGDRLATLQRCGHRFHVECVEQWLIHHPNCPVCRTPVVYLKKWYEIVTSYSLRVLETIATWLTGCFSRGLCTPVFSGSCRLAVSYAFVSS